jgi:8-oxo-dGTP diphosphatase
LVREFAEELAVPVTVGKRLFAGEFSNGARTYALEAYETALLSREFRLTEHSELRWVTPDELAQLDLSDSDRQVAEAVFGTVARHV